jgi:hypothetical protein
MKKKNVFKNLFVTMFSLVAMEQHALANPKTPAKEELSTKSKAGPQIVPLTAQPKFWSKEAKLISYRCKDMKLEARSRISPSTVYKLTSDKALFNERDCKESVKTLESKGCFCDDRVLKCLESVKVQPLDIVCPTQFICFQFLGNQLGVIEVKEIGDHTTREKCEQELADLERD